MSRSGVLAAGCFTVDQVKVIDQFPDEEDNCFIQHELPNANGGGPYNLLKNIALLGTPSKLWACGRIGHDDLGSWMKGDLEKHGISPTNLKKTKNVPTSYTVVLTSAKTGKRTFVSQSGANSILSPEDIPIETSSAKIFYYGYPVIMKQMDAPCPGYANGTECVMARAHKVGMITVMDLTTLPATAPYQELVLPAVKYLDYLLCNEIELSRLSKIDIPSTDNASSVPDLRALTRAALVVLAHGHAETRIVVHFQHGCVVASNTDIFWCDGVQLDSSDIQGTNGAGDAFAAGFVYSCLKKYKMTRCLRTACMVAAASLSSPTTSGGIRPASQIASWVDRKGFTSVVKETYEKQAPEVINEYFLMPKEAATAADTQLVMNLSSRLGLWPVLMCPVVIDYGEAHGAPLPAIDISPVDYLEFAQRCMELTKPFHASLAGVGTELALSPAEIWFTYVPLAQWLLAQHRDSGSDRILVGIGGGPGSGKTTLAAILTRIFAHGNIDCATVAMDGYHYPNAWLDSHNTSGEPLQPGEDPMRKFKGCPGSFDVQGLITDLQRICDQTDEDPPVPVRIYDRQIHDPVLGGDDVSYACPIVFVEGMFVSSSAGQWERVRGYTNTSIHLISDYDQSKARLIERKVRGGRTPEDAAAHFDRVDGPNLQLVQGDAENSSLSLNLSSPQASSIPSFTLRSLSPDLDPVIFSRKRSPMPLD